MGKKIALAAGNLLCVLAILVSALIGWTVITTPQGQAPNLFGYSFMTVLTGSMEPAVPRNSMLVVKQIDPVTLKKGDIISFYTTIGNVSGVINTHRVEEVLLENGNYSFRTRGDANSATDPEILSSGQVIGKVVAVSYPLGVAISFLRQKAVFLALVLIPLLLILVTYIRRLVRLAKEEIALAEQELESEDELKAQSEIHPETPSTQGDSAPHNP